MILEVAKNKALVSLENGFLKKTIRGEGKSQIDPPTFFKVKPLPFDNLPAPGE